MHTLDVERDGAADVPEGEAAMDRADAEDVAGLCDGDEAAMERLVQRHAPPLIRYLRRMLADESDASDLAQETFVRLHRECRRYDARRRLRPWLFTVAGNLARNQLRWRSRHVADSLDAEADVEGGWAPRPIASDVPCPSEVLLDEERKAALREAIDALPDGMRAALLLVDLEECSVAEAAVALGIPPRTVESRLFHARRRLRDHLVAGAVARPA